MRIFIAVGITSLICWGFAFLGVYVLKDYAWSLFIWLPFVLGAVSTIIYGYRHETSRGKLFSISCLALVACCAELLVFGTEGFICIAMVLPMGLLFTWLGHWVGYKILRSKLANPTITTVLLLLSVPSLMAFENNNQDEEKSRSVTTSIEIDASPEQVWKNVIAFPELAAPTEFIFKTGIAYPVNATIDGKGKGAIRYCNFSTGRFVEPITVWKEAELLRFSVTDQPEPMKELSFYDIHPNHLQGYWVSKEGQFKLTKLPNGHTLLEGTTWYVNNIKPEIYWTVWSDFIVHKIHQRVLNHIKMQSEFK